MTVQAAMGSRLSLAALTLLAGCGLPSGPEFPTEGVATAEGTHLISSTPQDRQSQAEMLDSQPPLPITHGALSRERSAELAGKLDQMLAVVLPEIDGLHADLDKAIAALPRPEHLATADPVLKTWRADDIAAYQDRITLYFDEAARRLTELRDATLTEAIAQARTLATPRGPMDTGATGDPALDTQLETFEEVLDGAVAMNALNVKKSGALVRRLDLFEAFSTFGVPQEAAMGGRILLFVGGDETGGVPRGVLAFRIDDERDPKRLHVVQALRHRILRGNTMVADLGWRLAPVPSGTGKLATETLDNLLIVPHFEPVIDQNAPAYDQLKDMRIQVDGQLAVFDGDKLLGGADWRVEFVVDLRGQLSWQVGQGKMMFDEKCEEVLGLGGK